MSSGATDYQVQLPAFAGPLDLLLQLIEREKLDISTISLAQVASQFLAYVREMEDVHADVLADFLSVAARLIWIKSRLLLPQAASQGEEEEEDPGEALARQLREYKRFKEVAVALRALEESGLRTFARAAPPPEMERRLEVDPGALNELLAAATAALASADSLSIAELPGGMVVPFTLTIHDQIKRIRRATTGSQRVTFRGLLSKSRHRLEIIVTLLAVLELIKLRQISVVQDEAFGEIFIEAASDAVPQLDDEDETEGDGAESGGRTAA